MGFFQKLLGQPRIFQSRLVHRHLIILFEKVVMCPNQISIDDDDIRFLLLSIIQLHAFGSSFVVVEDSFYGRVVMIFHGMGE